MKLNIFSFIVIIMCQIVNIYHFFSCNSAVSKFAIGFIFLLMFFVSVFIVSEIMYDIFLNRKFNNKE